MCHSKALVVTMEQHMLKLLERSGSGVELQTIAYENPGMNPVLWCLNPLGKFFNSPLLQFTQLYKRVPGYRQWWICV